MENGEMGKLYSSNFAFGFRSIIRLWRSKLALTDIIMWDGANAIYDTCLTDVCCLGFRKMD